MATVVGVSPDPLVCSPDVASLNTCNFYQFLNLKDVTMIMFYQPKSTACRMAAQDFALAAKETHRANHAYAAVDCSQNNDLCISSLAWTFPTFKVYNKAYAVTTVRNRPTYTHDEMRLAVEQAPPPPPEYKQ